jgi:hypothetical protein
MTHISYPDIGQFRNAIRNVSQKTRYVGKGADGEPIFDTSRPLPNIRYSGTVKLHGTNFAAGLNLDLDGFLWFQSRGHIITPESDNNGAARHFSIPENKAALVLLLKGAGEGEDVTVVYGEWCGQGIQKGVAITALPKRLVVFDILVGNALQGLRWLSPDVVAKFKDHSAQIYNIYEYRTFFADIDFNHPETAQNTLAEITSQVERECPVGAAHGVSGVGEGVVWKPVDPAWCDSKLWFKVKGAKHSVTKVKTLVPIDIEKVNTINEFVASTVTEARCQQSLCRLREAGKPMERASMGEFIRWIYNDIVKEESDTANGNNLDLDKLGGPISKAAREWFFKHENEL